MSWASYLIDSDTQCLALGPEIEVQKLVLLLKLIRSSNVTRLKTRSCGSGVCLLIKSAVWSALTYVLPEFHFRKLVRRNCP